MTTKSNDDLAESIVIAVATLFIFPQALIFVVGWFVHTYLV